MSEKAVAKNGSHLHRALGLKDLVLMNIASIIALSSLAQVAQFGFGSLLLYVIAVLTFLIPSGLMVAELNARMPEEGGFYLWTRSAFGDLHGYIAAWCYWVSNIVWLPTVMLLISVSSLYIFGDDLLWLADNPWYNSVVCLGVLWLVTVLNILGMERAKWVQNLGGIATWVCIALLLVAGTMYVFMHGSAHSFSASRLIPKLGDASLLPYFAIVAFCFGGLELAPVLAGEIREPRRNIPRAIIISSISVAVLYMAGTLMLILTVAEGEVGIIEGVAQAFREMGRGSGIPYLPGIGAIGAMLVAASTLGLFGAWMTGTARVPFVIGLHHYLPDGFAKVHARWGSPYVSLLVQALVLTLLFLSSIFGSTVKEAFLILLDMSIILYFIPFLYMFASLVIHLKRNTGGEGVISIFRTSTTARWLVVILGFGTTLFSTVISSMPTNEVSNKEVFVLKVVGGAALLIGIGLALYFQKRRVTPAIFTSGDAR